MRMLVVTPADSSYQENKDQTLMLICLLLTVSIYIIKESVQSLLKHHNNCCLASYLKTSWSLLFFLICIYMKNMELHGGVVVSTVASQQEGSSFDSCLRPFCVEFACSPCVCVGSLRVLRLPPTVQKHVSSIGVSRLSLEVNVNVCVVVCLVCNCVAL